LVRKVEKVLPELVHTDESGYKYVAYGKVVPLLVEGVKELWSKVQLLEETGLHLRSELPSGEQEEEQRFPRNGGEEVMDMAALKPGNDDVGVAMLERMAKLTAENKRLRAQLESHEARLQAIEAKLAGM
jgi:hypothetical protein